MSKTLEEHNYYGIDATIIADSKNEHGQRITSFVCTFPRIVLAEFNTHRMLSRNSASSRAVPFNKMLKQIEEHPFIPIKWMKDHKGMQGDEYLSESESILAKADWLAARSKAMNIAQLLSDKGVTKQFVNRLLEPFKWHTVIVTATEWENFFALRAHEAAEIHIQKLAFMMLEEYNNSEPKQLKAGEWHIPFGDNFNTSKLDKMYSGNYGDNSAFYIESDMPDVSEYNATIEMLKVKIATARCARVSYENFEGGDDYQKDIDLHDRLANLGHWSPMEHCARAMDAEEIDSHVRGQLDIENAYNESEVGHVVEYTATTTKNIHGWSGNFQGFVQYRKMFNNENKKDERVQ